MTQSEPHDWPPQNVEGMHCLLIDIEEIGVFEYHPLPDGKGKPTEVHMLLHIEGLDDIPLLMRFKGPDTLDRIVAALVKHRVNVFGND